MGRYGFMFYGEMMGRYNGNITEKCVDTIMAKRWGYTTKRQFRMENGDIGKIW